MLSTWPEYHRTMNSNTFRVVIVAGVVLISLLGVLAFGFVLAGELTDRSIVVLTAILGFLGPTIASLLVLLRVDANSAQTDRVQKKVEDVHHDILNGGLRDNVKKAISEDRHEKRNRDTIEQGLRQLEERRRARGDDLA